MKNQSLTITGLFISLITFVVQQFNLNLPQEDIANLVMSLAQVAGIFLAWYGRHRKGDINLLGKRKKDSTI